MSSSLCKLCFTIKHVRQTRGYQTNVDNSCIQLVSHGVLPSVLSVSSASAEEFRFQCGDFCRNSHTLESVKIGDGAVVILDDRGTFGKEEMAR